MSYINPEFKNRLVIISVAKELFGDVTVSSLPININGLKSFITNREEKSYYFITPEPIIDESKRHVYNMPFLFLNDGSPWNEANNYLMHSIKNKSTFSRPTDDVRRKASRLLDYLLFCEKNDINWLDFSGKRPSLRPTYRYYHYLINKSNRSPAVINQYTGTIYEFYKFTSKYWHPIDINRVDTTKSIKIFIDNQFGTQSIDVVKRSQTLRTPSNSSRKHGYIIDDGESLRPLMQNQLDELLEIIQRPEWAIQERLIVQIALSTGARKQSILTLRSKHINSFKENLRNHDQTYTIHAGPLETGIDTKFGKKQQLYFPIEIAKKLLIYYDSKAAAQKRLKHNIKFNKEHPNLPPINDSNMYVFLSDQGNPYYLSKSDPRFPLVKTRPTGQITEHIKRKVLKNTSQNFPKDFKFHWLRATYAHQLYLWLQPFIENGQIKIGDEISIIQQRLHHSQRETTENYLKLFQNIDERLEAQEKFEHHLFSPLTNLGK